jgi:hypothetical protein
VSRKLAKREEENRNSYGSELWTVCIDKARIRTLSKIYPQTVGGHFRRLLGLFVQEPPVF